MELQDVYKEPHKLALRLAKRADRRVRLPLVVQGGDFGTIIGKPNGELDTSLVEGVDGDLVIRPFGRKGEFDTVRGFDTGCDGIPYWYASQLMNLDPVILMVTESKMS